MLVLNATIYMAHLSRHVSICVYPDDTKEELYGRFSRTIGDGAESAILSRLIKMVREEDCDEGIRVRVEIAPYGSYSFMHEHCDIEDRDDLCRKLAELTLMVLKARRDDE